MVLTPEKRKEFETVTKPVIEWLNKNANPHSRIIIETGSAELNVGVHVFMIPVDLEHLF